MKIVAVIQARMGSTRLPGKVLMPILGQPMLKLMLSRVKLVPQFDRIVVATTNNQSDNKIVELIETLPGIDVFRGSENDVLDRYYRAAKKSDADVIARITADNPFFDSQLAEQMLGKFTKGKFDYLTSGISQTFPYGIGMEVFSMVSFKNVHQEAKTEYQREHVTPYYYQNPELFRLGSVDFERDLSSLRLTVDTPEDFARATELFERFGPEVSFREIADAEGC